MDYQVAVRRSTYVLLAACIAYFFFVMWAGYEDVLIQVQALSITSFSFLLLLSLINYFLRFIRWGLLLGKEGANLSYFQNLVIYLSGFALTLTPAKAGEVWRTYLLLSHGVKKRFSILAFIFERLYDVAALCLLIAFYFLELWQSGLLFCASYVCLIYFCPWLGGFLQKRKSSMEGTESFIQAFSSWKQVLKLLSLSLLSWSAEAYALQYLAYTHGINLTLTLAMMIHSSALLLGALSFLPGGLGGTELVMTHFLMKYGYESGAAVGATLIMRVATLWFAIIIGILAIPLALFKKRPENNPLDG